MTAGEQLQMIGIDPKIIASCPFDLGSVPADPSGGKDLPPPKGDKQLASSGNPRAEINDIHRTVTPGHLEGRLPLKGDGGNARDIVHIFPNIGLTEWS